MFRNFKYLELTSHHLINKTQKMIKDSADKELHSFEKQSEVVFSSALSLFLTYLAETYFSNATGATLNFKEMVLLFFLAIIIYFIFYFIIKKLYSFIYKKYKKIVYQKKIYTPDLSIQKTKELINDFDHIAFDNLIISYEFLKQIGNSESNQVKTFYFHEAIYYLRTSVNKAKEITHPDRRSICLNIFKNVNGIDVFRLVNAYKMMTELHTEISSIFTGEDKSRTIDTYDDKLMNVLKNQIDDLGNDITQIGIRCQAAQNDIISKQIINGD